MNQRYQKRKERKEKNENLAKNTNVTKTTTQQSSTGLLYHPTVSFFYLWTDWIDAYYYKFPVCDENTYQRPIRLLLLMPTNTSNQQLSIITRLFTGTAPLLSLSAPP